ncbi:MAG: hypothetical protein RI988_1450 [Pseudomonadota bacterium]
MNLDAFLFLQRSDVSHYVKSRPALGDIPHLFIDPGLTEEALRSGLDARNFLYLPLQVGRHFQAGIAAEAKARATLIDRELSGLRRNLFGTGVWQGWDEGVLWLFFQRALVARQLGELCDEQFTHCRVGLFRPSVPQRYYFDSFLTTDLFVGGSERWRIADHYDALHTDVPDHASHCFDFDQVAAMARAGHATAVTHLPTCYAHGAEFIAAIAASHPGNIDLPSPMWDIAVRRGAPMQRRLDELPREHLPASAFTYRDEARVLIERHLAAMLPGRVAARRQADSLAAQCFVQAVNCIGLLEALQGTKPHFIVSDHDTGSNGPLFSVAAALDAPISVLPHSTYPAFPLPHASRVRAVERHGLGTRTRTVLGEAVTTAGVALGRPLAPAPRQAVGTVCLMVNTLHGQGLSHIDLAGLARFHEALAQACRQAGARLVVRLKPNGAGVLMASSALNLPAEDLLQTLRRPLAELADETDLCINYGEPTTGGIEFLCTGAYLMCVSEQTWPADHWMAPGFMADGVVASSHGAQALAEVVTLLASPAEFRDRVQAQQDRLRARTGPAEPLFPSPAVC